MSLLHLYSPRKNYQLPDGTCSLPTPVLGVGGLALPDSSQFLIHTAVGPQGCGGRADSRRVGCKCIWCTPGWLCSPPSASLHICPSHAAATGHVYAPHFIWFLPPLPALRPFSALEGSPGNECFVSPGPSLPVQLSLKCRAPEVSQHVYQAYETILEN